MNELFNSFRSFLKKKYPDFKILKIPINAGFSCPNRDGHFSKAGCVFCDRFASGPIHSASWSINKQIEFFIRNHPHKKYIAYFQSHSNTYGPVSELKRKYESIFNYDDIIGLFIGTRPDAIAPSAFSLLEKLNRRIYLTVELGLQSIHGRSLLLLNRNHSYGQFLSTFQELKTRKIDTVVHLIIGIPGETRQQMLETVLEMNKLKPAGVKFHLMHVLKDTELYRRYIQTPFPLLTQEEYTDIVSDLLEYLDPDIVVHRLTAERDKEIFFAPEWALNKLAVLASLSVKMKKNGSFQGKNFRAPIFMQTPIRIPNIVD
jgi:radical SAM protein (TIGR01212 family)